MATLNELIYDILEDVRSYNVTDDSDIDERQVIYKINNQRTLWLRNEYNKPGRTIDPFTIQTLACVELEPADSSECTDFPSGCTILRTKCTLPKVVELHDRSAITKIGPVDMLGYNFSLIPYAQAPFAGSGKFNGKTIFGFIRSNRIYFKTNTMQAKFLSRVNIDGLFEDPTAVNSFCGGDTECFSRDDQYPINSWLVPYLREQVVKELVMGIQMPEDTTNDATSNEQGNAKQR